MTKYYETKIGKIIEKNFDSRMTNAVISYIIDKGWDNVKDITDEQIKEVKGNSMMTDRFSQGLVRTAREITRECNVFDDFLPFIRLYIPMNNYQTHDVRFFKEDIEENTWDMLLNDLNINDEDIEAIDVSAVVTSIIRKENY